MPKAAWNQSVPGDTGDENTVLEEWAAELDNQEFSVGRWRQTFQAPTVKCLNAFPNHLKKQGTLLHVPPDRSVLYFYQDS